MKKKIIALIATLVLSGTNVYAQFNTIREKTVRYKVIVINDVAEKHKEISLVNDTSQTKGASAVDTLQQQKPSKIAERTKRTIGVSYPLRNIVVTSPYGYRRNPFTGKRTFHNGIDLRANYEPVYSMLSGRAIKVSKNKNSGIYVILRYGNFTVSYCHLSNALVKKGDYIIAGQPIGISGNTGRSTGPHLHINIKMKNRTINPLIFIKNQIKQDKSN